MITDWLYSALLSTLINESDIVCCLPSFQSGAAQAATRALPPNVLHQQIAALQGQLQPGQSIAISRLSFLTVMQTQLKISQQVIVIVLTVIY